VSKESVISLTAIEKESWKESWDETLDGAPPKPIFHKVSYPPRLSLNGLLISALCTMLLVLMGFVLVPLPSPLNLGSLGVESAPLAMMQYDFRLPMALMAAALLGPYMGTLAILLFLGIGLFAYPVFAHGGGLGYIVQPGFGYLIGMLVAGYLLGNCFHKAFQKQDKASRSLKIMTLALFAVLTVHLLGALYMVGLSLAGQVAWPELPGILLRLSAETAPYDLLATAVFLCMVRQIRLSLWLVLY
jgi:biotin transport system substrate-specific component